MGSSTNSKELAKKLYDAAHDMGSNPRQKRAVGAAALVVKDRVEREASRSGVTPRQSKIAGRVWRGVRYDIKGRHNPTALVRALPPAHLVNNDTNPHVIAARKATKNRRRKGSKAMSWSGASHPVRRVKHPGTRGKGFWGKGVTKSTTPARDAYAREIAYGLKQFF